MGCLYQITFPNGKSYIGITAKTAEQRFKAHVYEARIGTRGVLYSSLRKYGAHVSMVKTLVIADDWQYLCELERKAISAYGTRAPAGLNLTDGGDGASIGSQWHLGHKHSDEAKAKMSRAHLGFKHSDEAKAKISAAGRGNKHMVGRSHSPETRAKQSAAHMGMVFTEEHRANIVIAARKREAERRARRAA